MTAKSEELSAALSEVLKQERTALTSGDFDAIRRLVPQKARLIDAVNTNAPRDAAVLQKLQEHLTRNQELLHSAMDGVRSVAEHIQAARSVQSSLKIYDGSGRAQQHSYCGATTLERRA